MDDGPGIRPRWGPRRAEVYDIVMKRIKSLRKCALIATDTGQSLESRIQILEKELTEANKISTRFSIPDELEEQFQEAVMEIKLKLATLNDLYGFWTSEKDKSVKEDEQGVSLEVQNTISNARDTIFELSSKPISEETSLQRLHIKETLLKAREKARTHRLIEHERRIQELLDQLKQD
jgi:hypothetical protein